MGGSGNTGPPFLPMAIETYSHDTPMEPEEVESETVEIPTSLLGEQTVSPGDVVRLEVVALNDDSGTVTVKYATAKDPGGIDEAVKEFEG